jgi:hypothetical protein
MRGAAGRAMTLPMMAAVRVPQISVIRDVEPPPPASAPQRRVPPPPPPPPPPESAGSQSRRHGTVKMQVVAPEPPPSTDAGGPSSGRFFDDDDFQGEQVALELELDGVPSGHTGYDTVAGPRAPMPVVRFTPQPMRAVGEPTLPVIEEAPSEPTVTLVLARPIAATRPTASREMPITPSSSPVQRPVTPATALTPGRDPKRPGIFAFAGFGMAPDNLSAAPTYAFRVLARRRVLRRDLAIARARRSPDVELYEAALRTADEKVVFRGLAMVLGVVLGALGACAAAIELLI